MARLYRPHIPIKTQCEVAARQLGWHDTPMLLRLHRKGYGGLRAQLLTELACKIGCDVKELRLDHDPPLAARQMLSYSRVVRPTYIPNANDPDHLFYRPHGPQHEGSHLIKTNIRGDHGQHPDRVLIKKARRMERGQKEKPRAKIAGRGFAKAPKRPWPKRKFGSK